MDARAEGRGGARAGLVSLGLIMQLVGSMMAAYLIARALEAILPGLFGNGRSLHFGDFFPDYFYGYQQYGGRGFSSPAWHLSVLASLGIVRALLHRFAGGAILYRHRGAFAALCVYLAAAFLHTALCLAFLHTDFAGATYQWSIVVLVAAAWPTCLLVAAARPSFRRALRGGPAANDETAPDEVATLSIFLGLVGAMVALFAVYSAVENFGSIDAINPTTVGSTAAVVVCALLLVRALWQLASGLRVAGRPADGAESLATRSYVRMALVASALGGVALLAHLCGEMETSHPQYDSRFQPSFTHRFSWSLLPFHALVAYLLFLWPILLRRFLLARTDVATSIAATRRPAASLAALGWFLLGVAAVQLALAAVALVAGSRGTWLAWYWAQQYLDGPIHAVARSPWLQILMAVPQVWVALELLGGTRRRKTAATAFAVVATLATVYSIWGDLQYIMRLIGVGLRYPTILAAYFQVAFPLLVPIVTLVFVQHHLRKAGPVQTVTEP